MRRRCSSRTTRPACSAIPQSARRSRSGFHPIRVTVNRPDAQVIVRSGYYDRLQRGPLRSPPPSVAHRSIPPCTDSLPSADLPLSVTAAPFRVAGSRNAAVAVVGGLTRPAGHLGDETVDVAVRAFDERSQMRASKGHWTSTIRLQPQVSLSGAVHYDAVTRLDLPPGRYEVRLSMRRASDDVAGGVATFVTVPNFENERLSLSGAVLGRPSATPPAKHLMSVVLPFAPTTVRTFRAGEAVTAMVASTRAARTCRNPRRSPRA